MTSILYEVTVEDKRRYDIVGRSDQSRGTPLGELELSGLSKRLSRFGRDSALVRASCLVIQISHPPDR